MIDFHTHILPGMDDGSKSVEESIWLLQEEVRQGVDAVMLTPHFYAEENSPVDFLRRRYASWKRLSEVWCHEYLSIRLGAEVQYFEGICAIEDIRHLRIVGTNFLLLEMPFCRWTDRMIGDILELNDQWQLQVVLAHIERYMAVQTPDLWAKLRAYGILMQSNVSFFSNWKTKGKAMHMLANGGIQFLGTDCHNSQTRKPNWDLLPDRAKGFLSTSGMNTHLRRLDTDGVHLEFV